MSKFKIGDKVRVLSNDSDAINDDTRDYFNEGDISTIKEIDFDGVNLSVECGGWINVEHLELVEDEQKVYTKDDIYEGMVLECVKPDEDYWTVGKNYVVDKDLYIYDDDGDSADYDDIIDGLNYEGFKVLEPKKINDVVEEYFSMPRLKGVNIEAPIMSIVPLADNTMIVDQEHYTNNGIQPIEIMKANFTKEEYRGFLLGNIVKYPLRYKDKNGLEDLKKTNTYLTWLIQDIEERGL